MLLEVLTRLSVTTGFNPDRQRNTLLNYLNAAAREMYNRLECNNIYWESTIAVKPNNVVTLPNYMFELRGMRMATTETPFNLQSMAAPRYVNTTWSYKWKNWRDMGTSPIQQAVSVNGPLTILTTPETTPVTLYIAGKTAAARRKEETVTLSAASQVTTNSFSDIYNLACLAEDRESDIVIYDANGTELATLYNNDRRTRYKVVDVSQIPWPLDTTDGSSMIDVLYKVPLYTLSRNSDQFPGGDEYDDAWYFFALWLYYLPMQNKAEDAAQALAQALVCLQSVKDGSEKYIEKRLVYGPNKFMNIFKRRRFYPGAVTNVDYYVG